MNIFNLPFVINVLSGRGGEVEIHQNKRENDKKPGTMQNVKAQTGWETLKTGNNA